MWTETAFRKARLKSVRAEWRRLRRNETLSRGRVAKAYLEFHSERALGPGITYWASIQHMGRLEPPPVVTVRCLLFDERIAQLRQRIGNSSVGSAANCDVLAAHNCLTGQPIAWEPPVCALDAPEDELLALLAAYSKRLDDLWEARGGYDLHGFRSLALWLIWHRHRTGIGIGGLGEACAAYLYDDAKLARTILVEYEEAEARLAREDSHPMRPKVHARIQADIARLREIIERNPTPPVDEL
jgi:hypothetical protein